MSVIWANQITLNVQKSGVFVLLGRQVSTLSWLSTLIMEYNEADTDVHAHPYSHRKLETIDSSELVSNYKQDIAS